MENWAKIGYRFLQFIGLEGKEDQKKLLHYYVDFVDVQLSVKNQNNIYTLHLKPLSFKNFCNLIVRDDGADQK